MLTPECAETRVLHLSLGPRKWSGGGWCDSAGAGRRLLGKIDFPETRLRPRPGALLETQTDTAQGKNGSLTEEGRQASGKGGEKDEAET